MGPIPRSPQESLDEGWGRVEGGDGPAGIGAAAWLNRRCHEKAFNAAPPCVFYGEEWLSPAWFEPRSRRAPLWRRGATMS